MAKNDVISERVRLLLDAAREHFGITTEWVERGDPRCNGRDFGFWIVLVGPIGWTKIPKPAESGFGALANTDRRLRSGVIMDPTGVEWHELERAIEDAIAAARKHWPDTDWPW